MDRGRACGFVERLRFHSDLATQWFAGKLEENYGLALASDTEAYGGHLAKARELTKRSLDSAIREDNKGRGAIWQANAALQQAAYGYAIEARQSAEKALKFAAVSQGVESEAALAFAMAGDSVRAESLAQDLGKRFPLDTQMQSLWLPAIQAQSALNRKDPAHALNTLQPATPIELGNIPFLKSISCLYPVYVRGEAYLAAGQGGPAASEFQKILDHSGIVWNCWTELWRIWEWLVPTPCSREPRREPMPTPPASGRWPPTKIFSPSGKTLTPTSPS
ncbi:MAG: hypothetical protein WCC37_25255 [Candidatus Sulfotelmatobacter sp.]